MIWWAFKVSSKFWKFHTYLDTVHTLLITSVAITHPQFCDKNVVLFGRLSLILTLRSKMLRAGLKHFCLIHWTTWWNAISNFVSPREIPIFDLANDIGVPVQGVPETLQIRDLRSFSSMYGGEQISPPIIKVDFFFALNWKCWKSTLWTTSL